VSIASGEIVAMLGPNGAGQTSTIDIILGLSRQTSGQAGDLCRGRGLAIQQGHRSSLS
jgi:ABC-2 type transport system ATP-binding protein